MTALRLGIAGLGTVGAGVLRTLEQNSAMITARCGRAIQVVAVSARDKNKARNFDIKNLQWVDDPLALAGMPNVDVVVELMGGDSPARQLVETGLRNGKAVITANKALIAGHGMMLTQLAEAKQVVFAFEAAVVGGIPVIKTIREALAANKISEIQGILNGTCNYILTQMRLRQMSFQAALQEAQTRGYAEADPLFDINGTDAAHKLAILAALAFGTQLDLNAVSAEGISGITPDDIIFAEELGFRIKLLSVARHHEYGLEQRVSPCLIPLLSPLASVENEYNAIQIQGDAIGHLMLVGRGAGAEATASAVLADIMDIAAGRHALPFNVAVSALQKCLPPAAEKSRSSFYLRLVVSDQPGVVADIATILRDHKISIESLLQRGRAMAAGVPVVITTHETMASAMQQAAAKIVKLPVVLEPPCVLRIENN
jgi:homoserine dehydrogenase